MSAREIPASVGQRLLWYVDRYRGQAGELNCPFVLRVRGRLDVGILVLTVNDLVERHEALRTTVVRRGRGIYQIVHAAQPVSIQQMDFSDTAAPATFVKKALCEELRTRIDPTTCPVRVTLYRESDSDHTLCINMHHLVSDAWSCGVVFRDFRMLFEHRTSGGPTPPAPAWQYSDFAQWQEESLAGESLRQHHEYWRRVLEKAKLPSLPLDQLASSPRRRSEREILEINAETGKSLRDFARAKKTTMFNVMLAIYCCLLYRLSGQTDLLVASLFANRSRSEVQQTVGFFANIILLRTRLGRAVRFVDVLSSVHRTVMDALLHQAVPYCMLPLNDLRDSPRRPDDVVFQMMPEAASQSRMAGLDLDLIIPESLGSRFELELVLVPQRDGFRVILFYNAERIDKIWARGFLWAYVEMTSVIAANSEICLADIP